MHLIESEFVPGSSRPAAREILVDIAVNTSAGSLTLAISAVDRTFHHPQQEWDQFRTLIVASYRKSGNSVFDVQDEMMKKHNFRASVRQYKYQLKKWRISKNMPAADKDAAAKQAETCFRQGKPLPLKRRDGTSYQWDKVRRRDLTKGCRVETWKQTSPSQSAVVPRVSGCAVPIYYNPNDPDVFYYNDLLMKQMRSFIPVSSIKAGLQDGVGDSALYHHVRRLYLLLCNDDSPTYDTREMMAGVRFELRQHMRNPSVILLMDLINICGWGRWRAPGRLNAAFNELLSIVVEMTDQHQACQKLFERMVHLYCRPDIWSTSIWYCLLTEMGDFQGLPAHAYAFGVHQVAKFQFLDNRFDAAIGTLERYLLSFETSFGEYSHWPRKLRLLAAAEGYEKNGMYAEARAGYEYASNTVLDGPDEITVRGNRGLLGIYSHQPFCNPELRIYYARKAFEASVSFHTAFDSGTLWDLADLRKVLLEYNRHEELDELEAEWQAERGKARKLLTSQRQS